MIKLHKFLPAWGLPDISPFCTKVETYLRMTNTPFEPVVSDSRKAPKGKLPYLDDGGTLIADSRDIIAHLERKSSSPLDPGISAADRALSVAYRGLLEEELYYLILYQRWQLDDGFRLYAPTLKQYALEIGVPGFVTPLLVPVIRRQVVGAVFRQGSGRHTPEQVDARAREVVDALATQLADHHYFLGAQPRTIDATVYAFLVSLMGGPFESGCKTLALAKPNLVAYADRFRDAFFP